ncbi:MAG: hypothetical protein J7501_08170, partial [Bdellovibrio sp.]|nr:hypothetical protein [Bdellovibrio sp.]
MKFIPSVKRIFSAKFLDKLSKDDI